uniref:Protein quiver n=1 Tax=Steinernema glaseri TaxID=37863 RepID=A0A1I8ABK8_9BILA
MSHWRHFFLKRNYGISQSDPECAHPDYNPDSVTRCSSTCYVLYLNGTDRVTGQTTVLGVGRGCSTTSLGDDQHAHLGLGTHAKVSDIGNYLSNHYDKLDITEHWCFCVSDKCNTQKCYTQSVFSRYMNDEGYLQKRRQSQSRSSSNLWRYYGNGVARPSLGAVALFLVALHAFSLSPINL